MSYAVLTDPGDGSVFLVDHRLAGLWLPAGGHVEPGEEPAVTAAREAREELGIEADFSIAGRRPVFVTVTRTTRPGLRTRTSACGTCWPGSPGMPIVLDPREFAGGRWWTGPQLESADPAPVRPGHGPLPGQAAPRAKRVRGQPRA